jgi:hypothetical protein
VIDIGTRKVTPTSSVGQTLNSCCSAHFGGSEAARNHSNVFDA